MSKNLKNTVIAASCIAALALICIAVISVARFADSGGKGADTTCEVSETICTPADTAGQSTRQAAEQSTGAQIQTVPATEAHVIQTSPATEAPVIQTSPATGAPVILTSPATDAPVIQTSPATEAPVVQTSPATEAPVIQTSPATEAPVIQTSPATEAPDTQTDAPDTETHVYDIQYAEACEILTGGDCKMPSDLVGYIAGLYGEDTVISAAKRVLNKKYDAEMWYELTGSSIHVLRDAFSGASGGDNYSFISGGSTEHMTFAFCGDIMLGDGEGVMNRYLANGKDIASLVSPDLINIMSSYDVMAANNEFSISDRGSKITKLFNYRGKPDNVSLYHDMGVDFVSVANNHVYDYGPDAFFDTMDALKAHNIHYAGAGKNLAEASKPFYYIINGRKIAIICGSRAEKNRVTPVAGENTEGVFGMYSSAEMEKAVAKAETECDFVIVFAHWGRESSYLLEDVIVEQAHKYIDLGADAVIGVHAHQLQSVDIYKGKFIAYNLGNFLFERKNLKTGIFVLDISKSLSVSASFVACIQNVDNVKLCTGSEKGDVLSYLQYLSSGVKISKDGVISSK